MFNNYVRVCVGRLTSFVDVNVFDKVFNNDSLLVIEEMMTWKDMTKSRIFRVESDDENNYKVYDDDNNELKFDY